MKNKIVNIFTLLLFLTCFTPPIHAAVATAWNATVSTYYTYGDYGNGDIVFELNNTPEWTSNSCIGGWIDPTQPGAKNLAATLMAAKSTGSVVRVSVHTSSIWSGSGNSFCKVFEMGLR